MLKVAGFSLLEMLIGIVLSSLIVIGCSSFYVQLQTNIIQYSQTIQLRNNVHQALVGLAKDIRRAGFIANDPAKMTAKALDINAQQNCVIIRYDSEIRNDWIYNLSNKKASDIFAYRYHKNNLEYKVAALDCQDPNWEKLFDPAKYKVTHFVIKPINNGIEISLAAELIKNKHINYQVIKIVKNENLF